MFYLQKIFSKFDIIKNNNQINIDNSIYFFDCSFNLKKEIEYKTINLYKGILYYISNNDKRKTGLPCFNVYNFFKSLIDKNVISNHIFHQQW